MNDKPKSKLPVVEWLKTEGRFQHLSEDEHQEVLEAFQHQVDERWERLLKLCGKAKCPPSKYQSAMAPW